VGSFSLRWYAVAFLCAWFLAFLFLLRRSRRLPAAPIGEASLPDLAVIVFLGSVIGGRIGYAALYDPSLFSGSLALVSPFDASGAWVGIWGMSFHGALIGSVVGIALFSRWKRVPFFRMTDFIVPAVPIALFFGRIGNFLNLELYGRETSVPLGMYFPGVSGLRHPSQLYEALLEGVVLFLILFFLGRKRIGVGMLSLAFLFFYGVMRFAAERFREPDIGAELVFGWMTPGQAFSALMVVVSVLMFVFLRTRKDGTLERKG
jgi:phosphatidylglycerol---prolipoprotein diacylglyceryl transferase